MPHKWCVQKVAFSHPSGREILSRLSYLFTHYTNNFLNLKRAAFFLLFFQWERALLKMKASLQNASEEAEPHVSVLRQEKQSGHSSCVLRLLMQMCFLFNK